MEQGNVLVERMVPEAGQQTLASQSPPWKGWAPLAVAPSPCSLQTVMSEELATELETKELLKSTEPSEMNYDLIWPTIEDGDTSSDLLLAQMLQLQLDAEHDQQLKREENKWNGTSKVKITYDKYRSVHPALQADTDAEFYEEAEEIKDKKVTPPCFNRSGFAGKGKNIVTKHDPTLCSRINATKVMENFPPEFETGDGSSFDMRLPNHVYNHLKIHSHVENKRSHRVHEKKEHSTVDQAIDQKTKLLMYKLVNSGVLEAVNGIVSAGKESVVFHADGGSRTNAVVPEECALKVFKTTLAEFRNRYQYVRGDVRFFKDEFKKQNPRKIMKIWAEKEEINLRKMEKNGIPCPSVVLLKKHILIMSFLGTNRNPAPKLKDAKLSPAEWQMAYEQCLQYMKTMYKDCLLVHGDLSEYNMLWHRDQVYLIDVAQSVDAMHPRAMEFLLRDCKNVSEFFSKRGVVDVLDEQKMFNDITGLSFDGEGQQEFLAKIEKYEKDEATMRLGLSKTHYPFDFFFERACAERQADKDTAEQHSETDSDDEEEEEEAEGTNVETDCRSLENASETTHQVDICESLTSESDQKEKES